MPRLFGRKLQHLRLRHGMTQEELARQLGLPTRIRISKLEIRQNSPSPKTLLQIAMLFEVTTDYLLRDTIPIDAEIAIPRPPISEQELSVQHFSAKLRFLRGEKRLSQNDLTHYLSLSSRA